MRETTVLPPLEESAFRDWAKQRGVTDVDDPESHYDYRGAYRANSARADNGHFTDQFKQHGHPTFSEESQYSHGVGDGGTWRGEQFIPAPQALGAALAPAYDPQLDSGDPHGGDLPTVRDLALRAAPSAVSPYLSGITEIHGGQTVSDVLRRNRADLGGFYGMPNARIRPGMGHGAVPPLPVPLGGGVPAAASVGAQALARRMPPPMALPARPVAQVPDAAAVSATRTPTEVRAPAPPSAALLHPVDKALEAAMEGPGAHPFDNALDFALTDDAHHSLLQPRNELGHFDGPPVRSDAQED